MKKSNAKEVSISPATAGEIIQKAVSANLQFKKDRGVKDYALAKEYGTSQRNIKKLLLSTRAETVDRITAALIKIAGVDFDPFSEKNFDSEKAAWLIDNENPNAVKIGSQIPGKLEDSEV